MVERMAGTTKGRSPLAGTARSSTLGTPGAKPAVIVSERQAGTTVQVIARRGQADAVRQAAATALAIDLSGTPRHTSAASGLSATWSGPGQWLVSARPGRTSTLADELRTALGTLAALVDQSDSRLEIELSGEAVRATLEKLVGIDVHDRSFPVGAVAMTVVAHVPVHVWREPDRNGAVVFVIAGPRSYAPSLWHDVTDAAAEFGCEARPVEPEGA